MVLNADLNKYQENTEIEDMDVDDLQLTLSSRGWAGPSLPTGSARSNDGERRDLNIATVANSWYREHGVSVSTLEGVGVPSGNAPEEPLTDVTLLELGRGNFQANIQHKRPKVLGYHDSCCMATTSCGSNTCINGSENVPVGPHLPHLRTENMVLYYCSDDWIAQNPMDSDVVGDGDPNTDDEVRMDLTEDLLHMVFSFLSHKDLCKAGATCKQWHAASSHEDFWRYLNFEDLKITAENFAAICHRYPNAVDVNILGVPEVDMLAVEAAMASLRKLERLRLGKGQAQLDDGFFQSLSDCSALKSLSINDMSLGSGIQEIAVQHENLHELEIIKCRVMRISVRCPQLQTLSLRRTTMAHALLNCPQLRKLDISCCHKLSDAGIRSAAVSCPLLTSLDMSFCPTVSDETLREIAFACPNLQVLDASFCPNVSLESVRLPMITNLKLHSCEGISSASVAAMSHSYMLEVLQLDCCGLLTSVSLDLPRLQNISLVHCRKFVDLNLRSPLLSSIKVSNCAALHRISVISDALQKLVLQKQESLATLSLRCHSLQEVDLTDCESLTNSVCGIFNDGGGCPMLRSLVLDNCEGLTEVGLTSSSLVNLSLVGCRAIISLELSCLNLQKVNLDGCDHLERASFHPVGLQSLNLGICPKLDFLNIEAPNMLVLELQGCGVLSMASINCPSLLSLDASFCSQLNDNSFSAIVASCPHIKSLVLSSCLSVDFDGLASLHWLKYLTELDLSYTFLMDLQPIFKSCSQLVKLRLMACKSLTNSSLDALYKYGALPALCELDLSYSSVCQTAIEGLLTFCTNLTNVNLNGCANMHDLVWESSSALAAKYPVSSCLNSHEVFEEPDRLLETLNCVGCPNIKRVAIPPPARCFYLTKLNLHLSANLKEVDITCFNLNSLNLSHCSSLEILKLNCPRLGILILRACGMVTEDAVEAALSGCNSLETLNLQHCTKIQVVNLGKLRSACPSLKRIHSSLWE